MLIVLHGGPGAPHSADGVARGLAARGFATSAPTQRAHTIDELIDEIAIEPGDVLIGASWGAMLALAFAAEHPDTPLVLVGCGPIGDAARDAYQVRRNTLPNDVDAIPPDRRTPIDRAQHEAVVADWRRRAEYPAAFASITAPVLMLHGALDPRPGELIRDALPIPQLVYRELPRCGHEPWRERAARDAFFAELVGFLRAA